MRSLAIAAAACFLIACVPPASTLVQGCTISSTSSTASPLTPSSLVVGTLTWVNSVASMGMCPAPNVIGLAAPCPTGSTVALPGVFCGPLVGAGGSAVCVWRPSIGGPSGLMVGFDLPELLVGYDGNIRGAAESTMFVSNTPDVTFTVTNFSSSVGKLMAYPYNAGLGPSPEDVTQVSCA